jgi:hypothetical protein
MSVHNVWGNKSKTKSQNPYKTVRFAIKKYKTVRNPESKSSCILRLYYFERFAKL